MSHSSNTIHPNHSRKAFHPFLGAVSIRSQPLAVAFYTETLHLSQGMAESSPEETTNSQVPLTCTLVCPSSTPVPAAVLGSHGVMSLCENSCPTKKDGQLSPRQTYMPTCQNLFQTGAVGQHKTAGTRKLREESWQKFINWG